MSSIKTTQIDGDVSVGRNVSLGGKAEISGSARIGHDLKVEGWLEAPNIKDVNKGFYRSVEALESAYPSPRDGWLAGVGASSPFAAYIGTGGVWEATGGTIEVTLDDHQYDEDISQLQENIDEVASRVEETEQDITKHDQEIAEAVTRIGTTEEVVEQMGEALFGSDGVITGQYVHVFSGRRMTTLSPSEPGSGFYLASSAANIYVYDMRRYKGMTVRINYTPATSSASAGGLRLAFVSQYEGWPTTKAAVTDEWLDRIAKVSSLSPTSVVYTSGSIIVPDTDCYLLVCSLVGPDTADTPLIVKVADKERASIDSQIDGLRQEVAAIAGNVTNDLTALANMPKAEQEEHTVGGRLLMDNIFDKTVVSTDETDITDAFTFHDGYGLLTDGTPTESRRGTLTNANSQLAYSEPVNIEGAARLYVRIPMRASVNSHGGLCFYDDTFTFGTSTAAQAEAHSHYVGSVETSGYADPSALKTQVMTVPVPEGAKYVALTWFSQSCISQHGTDTLPAALVCRKIIDTYAPVPKWSGNVREVPVQLERSAIGSTGGNTTTYYDNILRSPLPVRCSGPISVVAGIDCNLTVYRYADDLTYLSRDEAVALTAGVPYVFEGNGHFIRFNVSREEAFDTIPSVVLRGCIGSPSFFPRPADGYAAFTVGVNVRADANIDDNIPDNPAVIPSEVATPDINTVETDPGILALPDSYTPDGDPVRLILFCHGAGVTYGIGATRFNSSDIKPAYWLSEGYAIMDMDARAFLGAGTSIPHMCMDDALHCYLAGYEYVVSHYNIRRDGVFLAGRSMGGRMVMKIIASGRIPVIAACPHVPSVNISTSLAARTAGARAFYAAHMGFEGDMPEWTDNNPMTQEEWACYRANFHKLIRMFPQVYLMTAIPGADELMSDDFRVSSSTSSLAAEAELYQTLAIKTSVPVRISSGTTDSTCRPLRNARYLYWMLRNGGSYVEWYNYDSSRMTDGGSPHRFEIDSAFLTTVTNSRGQTLTGVPYLYVEMLRFWRRWEQKGGY